MMALAGSTAVITGGSSGIGEQFAVEFARRGVDLVLVARRPDRLDQVRARLVERYPDRVVEVIPSDLTDPAGVRRLAEQLAAREPGVDILVNNAGVGSHGAFVEQSVDAAVGEVELNCTAVVDLTRHLLPRMLDRRRGLVVNVASTAAFQPVATMAVYAATKAFVLSFTEALWAETRSSGVRILALCPGPTETEFFARTGEEFMTRGRQTSEQVVTEAMKALEGSAPSVVTGLRNKILAEGYRLAPRRLMAAVSSVVTR